MSVTKLRNAFNPTAGFVPYLMVGDPSYQQSIDGIEACIKAGATVIELGTPFSDPPADGPTIQAASMRSIKNGGSIHMTLKAAQHINAKYPHVAIILMLYYNTIYNLGIQSFLGLCAQDNGNGPIISGIIVPDLPNEECAPLRMQCQKHEISLIQIATPLTSPTRLAKITQDTDAFIYFTALIGITGQGEVDLPALQKAYKKAKEVTQHTPMVIGFGIKNQQIAQHALELAQGFVVGSALVQALYEGGLQALHGKISEILPPALMPKAANSS